MEFFAGTANASWCLKQFGLAGLSFDVNCGGRYNNIFEPSGFACLCLCYVLVNMFPSVFLVFSFPSNGIRAKAFWL